MFHKILPKRNQLKFQALRFQVNESQNQFLDSH